MMTTEQIEKLDEILSRGLCIGQSDGHGRCCLEVAVSRVMGGPWDDKPPGVALTDRNFWLIINDVIWTSPEVRARYLRPAALAQVGTEDTARGAWSRRVVLGVARRVIPRVLRIEARTAPEARRDEALAAASALEVAETDEELFEAVRELKSWIPDYDVRGALASLALDPCQAVLKIAKAVRWGAVAVPDGLRDSVLAEAVQVALDAYAEEGRP